jgi:chromate transport protein ChrA
MTIAGILYGMHAERPLVTAGLKGVAAAATGLLLATFISLARKTLRGWLDVLFIVLAVIAVNRFHVSVLYTLIGIAIIATIAYRPRSPKAEPPASAIQPEHAPS